jgi:hypothetical protein
MPKRLLFAIVRVSVSRMRASILLPVVFHDCISCMSHPQFLPGVWHDGAHFMLERHVLCDYCPVGRRAVYGRFLLRIDGLVGADRAVHGRILLRRRIIDCDSESVPGHDVLPDGLVADDRVPPRRILPFEWHGH